MPERHPIHQAYADAIAEDNPMALIPVGRTVLCDNDDTDLTDSDLSGGFMFGSYAIGPCCADAYEARARGYGELGHIRARCPEGMSFADWVRGMRGPDPVITVGPYHGMEGRS
jgi:hypothetical protein